MAENGSVRIQAGELQQFTVDVLTHIGMRREDAALAAKVLVTNDTWGVFTHGTKQLLNLVTKNVLPGRLDPKASAKVSSEGPSWAIVDGNRSMPMVTSVMAMNLAISKASATGIAYVGVNRTNHFGAAGYYALMAADAGMFGMSSSNCDICMTAPGARASVIGTNPFAYAMPAGREKPVFFDVAMSTVAVGKVLQAKFRGDAMPDTWVIDPNGVPATDFSRIPDFPLVGSVLPFAGHKGFGFAIMVEAMSAVMTGANVTRDVPRWWTHETDAPPDAGHAFVAINIGAWMPVQEFKDRVDRMITGIRQTPKAAGTERILVPGELEWERREKALREGIPLPADIVANHRKLLEVLGMKSALF
jgi:ureidoglycolate dehydrogenase (NAD+)